MKQGGIGNLFLRTYRRQETWVRELTTRCGHTNGRQKGDHKSLRGRKTSKDHDQYEVTLRHDCTSSVGISILISLHAFKNLYRYEAL